MTMAEYTPSDDEVRTAWHQYATATDAEYARLREDDDHPTHEFDRFLARVRCDAAREAEAERDEWRQTALEERAGLLDTLDQLKARDARR